MPAPAASVPEEAAYWGQKAQAAARNAHWEGALTAFEEYIRSLTTRDSRDLMSFAWILRDYLTRSYVEDAVPDLDAFRAVALARIEKLDKARDQDLLWRYEFLLADIERARDQDQAAREHTLKAIELYPAVDYPDPVRQSMLPHLYNIAALTLARSNLPDAVVFFANSFLADPRFNCIQTDAWQWHYIKTGNPEGFLGFLERMLQAFDEKIAKMPDKQDELRYYRRRLQRSLNEARVYIHRLDLARRRPWTLPYFSGPLLPPSTP